MNMHEDSDNNQGMEGERERKDICVCMCQREIEKFLLKEFVFVQLEIEEHNRRFTE